MTLSASQSLVMKTEEVIRPDIRSERAKHGEGRGPAQGEIGGNRAEGRALSAEPRCSDASGGSLCLQGP